MWQSFHFKLPETTNNGMNYYLLWGDPFRFFGIVKVMGRRSTCFRNIKSFQ
jgi:hypothetical protein